jgi:hypothetical protein
MRIARPRFAVLSFVLASAVAGVGLAEDLDPAALFDSARGAFNEKKYGKALSDLKLLVGEVSRLRAEQLKPLLPGAPAGWTAHEVDVNEGGGFAFLAQGVHLQRRYTKGDGNVTVGLWIDSPMVATLSMMANPAFAQMSGNTVVKVKGRQAVLQLDAANKSGTLYVLLAGNAAVAQVEGHGVVKADLVDAFGGAFDFDRLEKAIQE